MDIELKTSSGSRVEVAATEGPLISSLLAMNLFMKEMRRMQFSENFANYTFSVNFIAFPSVVGGGTAVFPNLPPQKANKGVIYPFTEFVQELLNDLNSGKQ